VRYITDVSKGSPIPVRFEVFMAVTMKNGILWDVTLTGPPDNSRTVINLSRVPLQEAACSALSEGLNYSVAPGRIPAQDFPCGVKKAIETHSEEAAEEIRQETVRILKGSRQPKDNHTRRNFPEDAILHLLPLFQKSVLSPCFVLIVCWTDIGECSSFVDLLNFYRNVIFEVFTAVTMKNGVFWDVMPCGSCKIRRFGRT
jgi:hypothetical protein